MHVHTKNASTITSCGGTRTPLRNSFMPHTPRPADLGRYTKVLVGYAEEEATCGRASVLRNPTFRRPSVLQSAGLLQSDGFLETRLFRCLCGPSFCQYRCCKFHQAAMFTDNSHIPCSERCTSLEFDQGHIKACVGVRRVDASSLRPTTHDIISTASSVFWLISGMDAGSLFRQVWSSSEENTYFPVVQF